MHIRMKRRRAGEGGQTCVRALQCRKVHRAGMKRSQLIICLECATSWSLSTAAWVPAHSSLSSCQRKTRYRLPAISARHMQIRQQRPARCAHIIHSLALRWVRMNQVTRHNKQGQQYNKCYLRMMQPPRHMRAIPPRFKSQLFSWEACRIITKPCA